MIKFIRVTMMNGDKYDIPASTICYLKALPFANQKYDERVIQKGERMSIVEYQNIINQECERILGQDEELLSWLSTAVNWYEVAEEATLVRDVPVMTSQQFNQSLKEGPKEIVYVCGETISTADAPNAD
jgi:hypothetical protein